jgi:cardiolipin synthase
MSALADAPTWALVAIAALAATVVLMVVAIWSIRHHRSPDLSVVCDGPVDALLPSLAGLSLGTVVPGNRVELLENGAFFDVLLDAMRGATRSIHFETFLWKDGVLGRRIAAALAERARAGVEVRVLLDAIGSSSMGRDVLDGLREAGCRVARFHRRRLRNLGVLNDRDHRKLVVLDGRVAFVGGHCVVDHWLGDAQDAEHYADLSARVEGPVVAQVQSVFGENWVAETGEMFVGDAVFPPLAPAGDVPMHVAFVKPERSAPAVKILHHAMICAARERLWIQNPYFIPEPEAIEAFARAVGRGVDVRVMMPSTGGSDNPLVQHAGHHVFERLLRAGVRLYEYPHTLLHQKTMVVDSTWAAIGSCNFDDRSFEINDEITLGLLDRETAASLEAIFERYAPHCHEIELERWCRRPLGHRVVDRLAYSINELL